MEGAERESERENMVQGELERRGDRERERGGGKEKMG